MIREPFLSSFSQKISKIDSEGPPGIDHIVHRRVIPYHNLCWTDLSDQEHNIQYKAPLTIGNYN